MTSPNPDPELPGVPRPQEPTGPAPGFVNGGPVFGPSLVIVPAGTRVRLAVTR